MKTIITLLLFICLHINATAQSPELLAKSHFLQAQQAYDNGNNEKALTSLSSCLEYLEGESNAKIEALYVEIYLAQKDYIKAKEHMALYFEKASEDHSDYMKMVSLLAETTDKAEEMKQKEIENVVFTLVETQPQYPGGMTALYNWIGSVLKYPEEARKMGTEGRVLVQFVVGVDGSISEVKILRGIGLGCDEEVLRVMQKCPKWNPGKQRGSTVKVRMILPVSFKLG